MSNTFWLQRSKMKKKTRNHISLIPLETHYNPQFSPILHCHNGTCNKNKQSWDHVSCFFVFESRNIISYVFRMSTVEFSVRDGNTIASIDRLPCSIELEDGKEQEVDMKRFQKTFRKEGDSDTSIFHGRPLIAHHYHDNNMILAQQDGRNRRGGQFYNHLFRELFHTNCNNRQVYSMENSTRTWC